MIIGTVLFLCVMFTANRATTWLIRALRNVRTAPINGSATRVVRGTSLTVKGN